MHYINLHPASVAAAVVLLSMPRPAPLKAVTVNIYCVLGVRLPTTVDTVMSDMNVRSPVDRFTVTSLENPRS